MWAHSTPHRHIDWGASAHQSADTDIEVLLHTSSATDADIGVPLHTCLKTGMDIGDFRHKSSSKETNIPVYTSSTTDVDMGVPLYTCSTTDTDAGLSLPTCSTTDTDAGLSLPTCSTTDTDAGLSLPTCSTTDTDAGLSLPTCLSKDTDAGLSLPTCSTTDTDAGLSLSTYLTTDTDIALDWLTLDLSARGMLYSRSTAAGSVITPPHPYSDVTPTAGWLGGSISSIDNSASARLAAPCYSPVDCSVQQQIKDAQGISSESLTNTVTYTSSLFFPSISPSKHIVCSAPQELKPSPPTLLNTFPANEFNKTLVAPSGDQEAIDATVTSNVNSVDPPPAVSGLSRVREVSTVDHKSRLGAHVLPPCGVCGAQATGYHYGANTCEPCKVKQLKLACALLLGNFEKFGDVLSHNYLNPHMITHI